MFSIQTVIVALTLTGHSLALAEPMVTAAAQLIPRASDPSLVGFVSESGSYRESRSCDYPDVVSTSNGYVQCCPTSGVCPFYTSCSSGVLVGASTTVDCNIFATLACNTAIVVPTAGANDGGSYLACWQTSLGSGPFTFVQDIGTATVAATSEGPAVTATSTGGSQSSSSGSGSSTRAESSSSSSRSQSASSSRSGSATAASTSSASSNAAFVVGSDASIGSGVLGGFLALVAQILL